MFWIRSYICDRMQSVCVHGSKPPDLPLKHGSVFGSFLFAVQGWGPGAVVKAACLESQKSRVRAPLWHSNSNEAKRFFPAHS